MVLDKNPWICNLLRNKSVGYVNETANTPISPPVNILHREFGYKGGLIKKVNSGYILAVFSGGSSEQDAEVSKEGLDWLNKYY